MRIAVLVKQIPDPTAPGGFDPQFRYIRDGKIILDFADLYGVETALQIKEKLGAEEVVAFSMVPAGETAGVRTALAMGVDRAIIISDEALANSNSLATAKVLNAAIDHVGECDLVITGVESSDGYTGTLAGHLAALRLVSALTFAAGVEVEGTTLRIKRQSDEGIDTVTADLPAVLSVTAGVVEPRYPNFKGIMAAKSKPCDLLTLSDIGVAVTSLLDDAQKVVAIDDAPGRESGIIVTDQDAGADKIIEFLESQGVMQ